MARLQTQSGGFDLDTAVSFPVYVEISNPTDDVSAVLNTGPSFTPPEGYSDWSTGVHIAVLPDGTAITASVNDDLVTIETFIMGKEITVSVGDVTVLLATHNIYPVGLSMAVSVGHARSSNWTKVSEAASTKEHWIKV